jgi:hypothetical protein
VIVNFVSVAHSFLPLIAVWLRRSDGDDEFENVGYLWTLAPLLTSMLSLFHETRVFLTLAFESIEEYKDAIDEIFVFLYISSSHSIKSRMSMRNTFVRTVTENDNWRKDNAGKREVECVFPERAGLRFLDRAELQTSSSEVMRVFSHSGGLTQVGTGAANWACDELEDLSACRAAFNFTRKEGIQLFRFMRKWVTQDIQTERFEVELCMDKLLVALGCLIALAAITWLEGEEPPLHIVFVRALDLSVLLYLIISILNLCVTANEHLFDETCRMLLDWSDKVAMEDSRFEGEGLRDPAIGWFHDVHSGKSKPLEWNGVFHDMSQQQGSKTDALQKDRSEHHRREEALRALDTTIKIMKEVEQKQMFLGMEVTSALRSRVVTAAVSAAVAWAGKKLAALGEGTA